MQITHNNKTYRWIGDKWGETFIDEYSIFWQWDMLVYFQYGSDIIKTYHTPEQLVKLGYLEEVKENKQTLTLPEMEYKWEREYYMDWQKCTPEQALEAMKLNMRANYEERNSILEKLREELERKVQQTIEQIEKTQQIRDCERLNVLREIQYLLTSLEQPQTKVDTEAKVWQELNKKQDAEFNAQPQFTPCQEHYSCKWSWDETQFAQEEPIEDKIELLPEFIAYPHKESWHIYDIDRNAEQIELLTNAINKLINK